MSMPKKLLFTAIFVLAVIFVPGIILLLTVDATNDFSVYLLVYGIILFAIFGYIIVSIHSLSKEMKDALEEMKKQNAAIAYKLTTGSVVEEKEPKEEKPKIDTSNVNLNPADPLTIDGKVVSNSFDDFK